MESINEKRQFEVAEIQISYKPKVKPSERPKVTSSSDAQKMFRENWDSGKLELIEQFKTMLLNRNNKALGIFDVSQGGIAGTVADPKVIFACALRGAASGIILAHYGK